MAEQINRIQQQGSVTLDRKSKFARPASSAIRTEKCSDKKNEDDAEEMTSGMRVALAEKENECQTARLQEDEFDVKSEFDRLMSVTVDLTHFRSNELRCKPHFPQIVLIVSNDVDFNGSGAHTVRLALDCATVSMGGFVGPTNMSSALHSRAEEGNGASKDADRTHITNTHQITQNQTSAPSPRKLDKKSNISRSSIATPNQTYLRNSQVVPSSRLFRFKLLQMGRAVDQCACTKVTCQLSTPLGRRFQNAQCRLYPVWVPVTTGGSSLPYPTPTLMQFSYGTTPV